jgi:hypothetical protein
MNKWIFYLLSLLPFYAIAEASPYQSEVQTIDQEIQSLKSRLHKNQAAEMKKEVEGQGLMIADWNAYAKDIEQIRKLEDQDELIRKQINKLEERKAYLIQQQSQMNKSSK